MTLNYLQPSADLRCQTNFKLVYAQGCVSLKTRKGGGAFSLVTASYVKEGQPLERLGMGAAHTAAPASALSYY